MPLKRAYTICYLTIRCDSPNPMASARIHRQTSAAHTIRIRTMPADTSRRSRPARTTKCRSIPAYTTIDRHIRT